MAIIARQLSVQHAPVPQVQVSSRRPSRSLLGNAMRLLCKDRLTIVAASLLLVFAVCAALAPAITQVLNLPANNVGVRARRDHRGNRVVSVHPGRRSTRRVRSAQRSTTLEAKFGPSVTQHGVD